MSARTAGRPGSDGRIVFSDLDGTLLTSDLDISTATLAAIRKLQEEGIVFVPISARNPPGIRPILERHALHCPVISFSGALIQDADQTLVQHRGMTKETAARVLAFLEERSFPVTCGIYAMDEWIVADKKDPRTIREGEIVRASAREGTLEMLEADSVSKILCICDPGAIEIVEPAVREEFAGCTVVRSSDILLEIMAGGVNKAQAVKTLCALWDIPLSNTIAFGDNYNDAEMLETVGTGFLMGNAPEALKKRIPRMTEDNDHDGIASALAMMGLV